MKKLLLISNILIFAFPALGWAGGCNTWDVYQADKKWQDAIGTNEADVVVDLYAYNAVLLPTFSVQIIDNQADRFQYFKKLFTEIDELTVEYDGERYIQFVEGGAISSGDYTFRGQVHSDGDFVETPARFTFVYKQHKHEEDGGCKLELITHHSSEQPFGSKITQLLAQ